MSFLGKVKEQKKQADWSLSYKHFSEAELL